MKNIILAYYKQLIQGYIRAKVYNRDEKIFGKAIFFVAQSSKCYRVNLFKKKAVIEKKLSLDAIEDLLSNKWKYQMISIDCKEDKKDIYRVIGKVSKKNGICSPFIELENCIIYFPQLRYSDLDLLKYLCEQRKIERYRLLMVSGC